MEFRTLLLGYRDDHSKERLSSALDRLDKQSRLSTVLSVTRKEQRELWEIFSDNPPAAEHFVPAGLEPFKEVIHYGKNTLPTHNFFQKRFCRAADNSGDLFGYNHQKLAWMTGPGYFIAHPVTGEQDPPSSYVIDYTRIPDKKPESWPQIMLNEAKLGRFVYAGMKDYMRKVSEHVSIGRAYKKGKPMNAWFILCREDAAS